MAFYHQNREIPQNIEEDKLVLILSFESLKTIKLALEGRYVSLNQVKEDSEFNAGIDPADVSRALNETKETILEFNSEIDKYEINPFKNDN